MEASDSESTCADDPISLVFNVSQPSAAESNVPSTNSLENESPEPTQDTSRAPEVPETTRKRKIALKEDAADSQDSKNLKLECDGDDLVSDSEWRISNFSNRKVNIYTEDTGSKWYNVGSPFVTPPIDALRLEEAFQELPIYGAPTRPSELREFQDKKLREFMGSALTDEEFEKVATYCSPDALKTGKEIIIQSSVPVPGLLSKEIETQLLEPSSEARKLCIVNKHEMRGDEVSSFYVHRLKYRGIRVLPRTTDSDSSDVAPEEQLVPGKDVLFRIRIYRPFLYNFRSNNRRHCVFSRDVVACGRQPLWQLRARLVCPNALDLRVDVSACPDAPPAASPKDLFPSGFMFINNVFYVDRRAGCVDRSAALREWAASRGMGRYPVRDMASPLSSVVVKLGHPDVYVHQGNCEHVFIFSEIRLLGPGDSLRLSNYPSHTSISQNQTVYCTTCAEFAAKWLVTGSARVPFDPAFFCDTCFRLYMYRNGQKIGEFNAYSYRGNDINLLKAHV